MHVKIYACLVPHPSPPQSWEMRHHDLLLLWSEHYYCSLLRLHGADYLTKATRSEEKDLEDLSYTIAVIMCVTRKCPYRPRNPENSKTRKSDSRVTFFIFRDRKRGQYERGLFTGGVSQISKISKNWSDYPLFSTVWGSSTISRISKFSRILEKWTFLKRPLFQKTPFSEPDCERRGAQMRQFL